MKYIFSAVFALLTSAFAHGADIIPHDTYASPIKKSKEAIEKVSTTNFPLSVNSRADAQWTDYGECDYTDDILTSFFSVEPVSYKVKVQKDEANEGVYRIVDPWTAYPDRDKIFAENPDAVLPGGNDYYILIDASNPQYVRILNSPIGVDDGYGVSTLCTRTELVGEAVDFYPLTQEEADLCAGILKDGVISFAKERSFAVIQDGSYYPANGSAAFRLDLNLNKQEIAHNWVDLGLCDYIDDIATAYFSVEPSRFKVQVQKDADNDGFYRIVDIWANYPHKDLIADYLGFDAFSSDSYIIIDATNPDYVRILDSPVGMDDGDGATTVRSLTELVGVQLGDSPVSQANADLSAGKLVDQVITFIANPALILQQNGIYYPANRNGAFALALPGGKLPTDYSFSLSMRETFCPDANGNYHITANGDETIESVRYAVMSYLPEKVDNSFTKISTACSINNEVSINIRDFDTATLYAVFATYDGSNEVKASTFVTIFNPDAKKNEWTYLGKADMTEGFLSCTFPSLFTEETYEVDVECLGDNKSILRVVNPYGDQWSQSDAYTVADGHDHYIFINAENPENVYIEYSPLGVYVLGYGECAISSDYVNLIASYGLSFLEMFDIYSGGHLQDNVLTFDRTCDIKILPAAYGKWIYTNIFKNPDYDPFTDTGDYDDRIAGNFKLDFSKAFSGIENVISGESTDSDTEYFNLQGVKVNKPATGIVLRRQGTKVTKEFIR